MKYAEMLAQRSTCKRLQVGTVITTTDFRKVLAIGYNGMASGLSNECLPDGKGGCQDIHSEMNAIANCSSPREISKVVFVTYNPCVTCAQLLVNMGGVQKVFYRSEYRILEGLDILRQAGVKVVAM